MISAVNLYSSTLFLLLAYGLTESASCGIVMEEDDLSVGCIGTPLQGCDVKVVSWNEGGYSTKDSDGAKGELHLGGNHVAAGYFNMPDKTVEEFYEENGKRWFKTGDIAQVMADMSFKIIDRKKDLVKLQMGEYVSLGKVESVLKLNSLVDNLCVFAKPSESFTVAVVVPDQCTLSSLAKKLNLREDASFEDICKDAKVLKEVLKEITMQGLSMGLQKFEIPKQIYITPDIWTPESGLVTAAMKLKRKEIGQYYPSYISKMYGIQSNGNIYKQSQMSPV